MAILNKSWCGERDTPVGIGGSVQKNLLSLKQKMEIAVDKALEYGDKKHMVYIQYRNQKTKMKSFNPGDEVLPKTCTGTFVILSRMRMVTVSLAWEQHETVSTLCFCH